MSVCREAQQLPRSQKLWQQTSPGEAPAPPPPLFLPLPTHTSPSPPPLIAPSPPAPLLALAGRPLMHQLLRCVAANRCGNAIFAGLCHLACQSVPACVCVCTRTCGCMHVCDCLQGCCVTHKLWLLAAYRTNLLHTYTHSCMHACTHPHSHAIFFSLSLPASHDGK